MRHLSLHYQRAAASVPAGVRRGAEYPPLHARQGQLTGFLWRLHFGKVRTKRNVGILGYRPEACLAAKMDFGTVRLNRSLPVPDQLYDMLRWAIVSLKLLPRQKLNEQDVATAHGVSRTPVRAAFLRLNQEGLLETYPQLGSFVTPIRMEGLVRAQFIREAIECAAIRRSAEVMTDELRQELDATFAAHQRSLESRTWEQFHELDQKTHRLICMGTSVRDLWEVVDEERVHLDRVRRLMLPDANINASVISQHLDFITAVRSRDPEAAEEAMRRHLREVFVRLKGFKDNFSDYFE